MMPGMRDIPGQPGPVAVMRLVPDAGAVSVQSIPARLDGPDVPDPASASIRRTFVLDEMTASNMPMLMGAGKDDPMGGMSAANHDMHVARSASHVGSARQAANSGLVMAIAGKPFAMDRIDAEVRLGSFERWTIQSGDMAHPFHVHGARFRVLSKNGSPPPALESGWKDTVLVEGRTEILIRFDQLATRAMPFMFHCHILEHEDLGMMGQYVTI